jgi:glycosyltransferase involved in cell wall biosynthesis
MSEKISVILPAFNEEGRLYENVKQVEHILNRFIRYNNLDYEIIIVNDGSIDNTQMEALKLKKQNNKIKVIFYPNNGGKGKALKKGFSCCKGDYVIFLDADMDISPKHISLFYKYLKKTGADVVVGSKRHPESNINYPVSRKFLSKIYQLINFLLFRLDITDTQTGIKIFKYEVLYQIFPKILCKKYAFDLELIVNANHQNCKIIEHPITLEWKRAYNRLKLKDIWQIALDTAAIFYRLKIIKHYTYKNPINFPKIQKVYDVLYNVKIK